MARDEYETVSVADGPLLESSLGSVIASVDCQGLVGFRVKGRNMGRADVEFFGPRDQLDRVLASGSSSRMW